MNSYDLSRSWFNFCFENPEKIKPNHSAVYFFAIEHCNRLGWKEKFGFPTTMVMEAVGIKSYNTYINTLSDLVTWKFIKMIEKSKNQYSANIIALSKFNKALDKALDKALIKHGTKQSESTVQSISSIDKQETNKQETNKQTNNKKENSFSEEVLKCYSEILNFFPEHLHPKKENEKENWLDTLEKLNRIDKIPFETILEIIKKTREDNFWSGNFLSITKLRKKNNDGIKYIVYFNEKFNKPKQNHRLEILKKNAQGWD